MRSYKTVYVTFPHLYGGFAISLYDLHVASFFHATTWVYRTRTMYTSDITYLARDGTVGENLSVV